MRVIAANELGFETSPARPEAADEPRGNLRVALPTALGRQYIVPALPRFAVQHPALKVRVLLTDAPVDLAGAGIDALVHVGAVDDPALVMRHVFDAALVTCASPDYLARHGTPRSPAELDGHDCLGLYSIERDAVAQWTFEKNGRRIEFTPGDRLVASDAEALVSAAANGAGIVTVLDVVAKRAIASGMLRPILADWQPADLQPISIVYLPQWQSHAGVRAFADFVAGLFPRRRAGSLNLSDVLAVRKCA